MDLTIDGMFNVRMREYANVQMQTGIKRLRGFTEFDSANEYAGRCANADQD
ncbi:hypothetical protein QTN47_12650 [Danxiaibacter flavus]|uniref:Uncharacterized protein n=1 Tax=Danxiaibacter flavus TaxID=3049108 RepID=A0ABV3ZIU4_9BACT|nr:hypothetical protein QNM32_12655 [Chitinophagaceae bacterium DXS]